MKFNRLRLRPLRRSLWHRALCQQQGQAALEAVLLTLLLALAVFSLVDDSPLAKLVFSLHDHHARMARGLALP